MQTHTDHIPAQAIGGQAVILGLGNELLGDEGVGVHAARLLRSIPLPPEVEVFEVGTAIIDFLPVLERAGRIIVVDAMKGAGPPGAIYTVHLNDCRSSTCIASMHGFDILRVMALVERHEAPPVVVFGVEPATIHWSMELSPQVATSLPLLVQSVQKELLHPSGGGACTQEESEG